jgi:hypothetical protein
MQGIILVLLWASIVSALCQARRPWGPLAGFTLLALGCVYMAGFHIPY